MKTTLTVLLIGTFAFAGTALGASVGKNIVQGSFWGFVAGKQDTWIYRIQDKDTGVTCYVSYTGQYNVSEMDCVK